MPNISNISQNRVLTTYDEVRKSYPRFDPPPPEMVSHEQMMAWWAGYYAANRGVLHSMKFYRIMLDEAQAIKNRDSQVFKAVRGLHGEHRWAITGTPLYNNVEEFYPYFAFLGVPHCGRFDTFKQNLCSKDDRIQGERLGAYLSLIMMRRTHEDSLFGAPLLVLPKNHQRVIEVELSEVERFIYNMIKNRFAKKINRYQKDGVAEKNKRNILSMLVYLRQVTSHMFLIQGIIQELVEGEDIEVWWRKTMPEVRTASRRNNELLEPRDMLRAMQKIFAQKRAADEQQTAGSDGQSPPDNDDDDDDYDLELHQPIVFKFRGILRNLAKNADWESLQQRTLCTKCEEPASNPYITDCNHLYCFECLEALATEAAVNGESVVCLECEHRYRKSEPCNGLKELGNGESLVSADNDSSKKRRRRLAKPENEDGKSSWMNFEGKILQSTKTVAFVAQILEWMQQDRAVKILVFTQFLTMFVPTMHLVGAG